MKRCDRILERTLRLTDLMKEVAEKGDSAREDIGCGVLYGFLRDSAFKIRKMAEEEKEAHIRKSGAATRKAAKRMGKKEDGRDIPAVKTKHSEQVRTK